VDVNDDESHEVSRGDRRERPVRGLAQVDLAEFNAINAEARAARERGDNAALLANMRKLAAIAPGHPSLQIAVARGLALDGDAAGAVAQLNRIAELGLFFGASDDAWR
jgi:hypothetical protein